jgi:cytochrome c biogenesis protein
MSTVQDWVAAPAQPPPRRANPVLAVVRNSWRQLTSMRTALMLLFLLAVAAIPGSLLPQRNVNPEKVNAYFTAHPQLAPVLNRLGGFDVFASVWFSAIYVLLFTSLIGCIVPRARDHIRALRAAPPPAPKRLDRLPQHAVLSRDDIGGLQAADASGGELAAIAAVLRKRRWRVVVRDNTGSAEKGYLKESGNLFFHMSLMAVLVGVGFGSWYGWHGNRILVAGPDTAFCNSLQQYDGSQLGPRIKAGDLPPFCLQLTNFQASYLPSGQPKSFKATVRVDQGGGQPRTADFSVNSPLRLPGANVYLLGHGYAPVIRYTDRTGKSQTTVAPFLSNDPMLTSEGVAAFPDVNIDPKTGQRAPNTQVAFDGLYLPTAPSSPPYLRSQFPAERSPALQVVAYRGDLGLDAGIPGSVYKLDQRQIQTGKLKPVGSKLMRPGDKWVLDDGTTMEFLGTRQYATLSVRYDPGEQIVLGSTALLLVGLMVSLTGRRRRVWFRVTQDAPAAGSPAAPADESTTTRSSLIEAGGLPRTDYSGFADEFEQLVAAVKRGAAQEEAE